MMQTITAPAHVDVLMSWRAGERAFFFTGETSGSPIPAEALARQLLAWDPASFYGTMAVIREVDGQEFVVVDAFRAVALFADRLWHGALAPGLSSDWDWLQTAALRIREALRTGGFRPDFQAWTRGETGFRVWTWAATERAVGDDSANASAATAAVAATVAATAADTQQSRTPAPMDPVFADPDFLDDWLTQALLVRMKQSPALETSWQQVVEAWPKVDVRANADSDLFDEEDWLTEIGLGGPSLPQRVGLRLREPVSDGVDAAALDAAIWRLDVVWQDRKRPDRITVAADPDMISAGQPFRSDAVISREPLDPLSESAKATQLARDVRRFARVVPWLAQEGPLLQDLSSEQAWRFLSESSMDLLAAGCLVLLPPWWEEVRRAQARLKAAVRTAPKPTKAAGIGLSQLLEFDWRVSIGDTELTEAEFRSLLAQQGRLVKVRGRWIQVDPEFYARALAAMERFGRQRGMSLQDVMNHYLLGHVDAGMATDGAERSDVLQAAVNAVNAEEFDVVLDETSQGWMSQLQHAADSMDVTLPDTFHGTLRPYQLRGVSWFRFLRQFGLGACLADDMGLGKTVQWIAYMTSVWEEASEEFARPSLLICPMSVLGNWQKELDKFAPSARVYIHHGQRRLHGEALAVAVAAADVVLTTYSLAQLDQDDLESIGWDVICLDEAQNIKNPYTKQSSAIRKLQGLHRIAMTGTPIENRLTELWSIYQFLNPGYLGSLRHFSTCFVAPVEKGEDQAPLEGLRRLTQPFMLRRSKRDPAIELDLPEKEEMKVFVQLTTEQGALYERVLEDMLERLDTLPPMERRGVIVATLTKLKQVCDHPSLFHKDDARGADWNSRSVKVERLVDMVRELREEGDRCLIFTQFVGMGERLRAVLAEALDEPVLFLYGGLNKTQRDAMIEDFQRERDVAGPAVFVLSLKAGGVGLNLTAANHVFHFDRWWNPAVEQQATDRAFRIGQTRRVQVHKFVALGTLEERIDEMIERKQALGEQVIGGGEEWITELSTTDLRDLFALRREWVE